MMDDSLVLSKSKSGKLGHSTQRSMWHWVCLTMGHTVPHNSTFRISMWIMIRIHRNYGSLIFRRTPSALTSSLQSRPHHLLRPQGPETTISWWMFVVSTCLKPLLSAGITIRIMRMMRIMRIARIIRTIRIIATIVIVIIIIIISISSCQLVEHTDKVMYDNTSQTCNHRTSEE